MEFKQNQKVTILSNGEYALNLAGKTGIVVNVLERGVNVFIDVFHTLPYQENIFFFNYSEVR